jgi:glycosyltransferase involved in cell wall biosynthesis
MLSVIMVVRNGEAVGECLESLRQQAYQSWELCVAVNRASESLASNFDGRIRSVGADSLDDAQALNAAARMATGE